MEAMIKQQMQQMQASAPPVPEIEIKNTGEKATKNGFPCVKHELYRDGLLSKVFWVTDWDNVEGGHAAMAAFEDMAGFMEDLQAALPDFAQSPETGNNAYENLEDLGGFPIVTLEYSQSGVLIGESHLKSSREEDVDPTVFDPPEGYTPQTMLQ